MVAIFLSASAWQFKRAAYKAELGKSLAQRAASPPLAVGAEILDAELTNLHPAEAKGVWQPKFTLYLDNKIHDGAVGYEVITPLQVSDKGPLLLVNRGWVKAPADRAVIPDIPSTADAVQLTGVLRKPSSRFIELSDQAIEGQRWQNLTIERFEKWSGKNAQPVMLYAREVTAPGFVPVVPAPEATGLGELQHRGYAWMWLGLAVVTAASGLMALRKQQHATDRK